MELERLVSHYTADFRQKMPITPAEVDDAESIRTRAEALPEASKRLLDTLLLVAIPGEPVEGLAGRIDTPAGEVLWQGGFLLPRTRPSRGSTIDPRFYAAACRLNPHLAPRRPFQALLATEGVPAFPPGDSNWDAVVVAAALETSPLTLNRDGAPRRDQLDRLLKGLGKDQTRWALALRVARATGRARARSGTLVGLPQSAARRISDPVALVDDHADAARLLLRVLGDDWISIEALQKLVSELEPSIGMILGLDEVADVFHRVGVVDAARSADGVIAVRKATPGPELPPGFLLTPDLDILVASGELDARDYGRLARLAPYLDGDRVHRHRLTRQGVAVDLALGNTEPVEFLRTLSRTGMPLSVEQSIHEWLHSAERLVLMTGVTVVEEPDGSFRVGGGMGRAIDYSQGPPASFHTSGDEAIVPYGRDALTVRAALAQVAEPGERGDGGWHFKIAPREVVGVESLLGRLRRFHVQSDLPSSLEVRVRSANGLGPARTLAAVIVNLPEQAVDALLRDPVAGPLLTRQLSPGQCVVDQVDMERLTARLGELGVVLA